jgi:hypothetical protein
MEPLPSPPVGTISPSVWARIFMASLVALLAVANIAISVEPLYRTSKTMYVQMFASKLKHMQLRHKPRDLDVILVGNSRTDNHTDTRAFARNGLAVYNMGIQAASLLNYPRYVAEIIGMRPKVIVVSMRADELYSDWQIPTFAALQDVGNLLQVDQRPLVALQLVNSSINTAIAPRRYAKQILGKLANLYGRFNPHSRGRGERLPIETQSNAAPSDAGCEVAEREVRADKTVDVKCTNGDSILFGNAVPPPQPTVDHFCVTPNKAKLQLIQNINADVEQEGGMLVVVLEPGLSERFVLDDEKLGRALQPARLINLSNLATVRGRENWANATHLNNIGRAKYNSALIPLIQALVHRDGVRD